MTVAIPASQIVQVNPGVIGAGGTGLDLIGLLLTTSWRVPIGSVYSFSSLAAVQAFFGAGSAEASFAATYFLGYDNSAIKPGSLLFTQYPWTAAVAPYLESANLASMTLAQLQAIAPGTLSVTINGVAKTSGSINLSTATSFSNAASIIQTALGANDAGFTAAIAPSTASVTGAIAVTGGVPTLTVSAVGSGTLVVGGTLSGTGVSAGTQIVSQLTGTAGGVGTYVVSISQSVSSTAISETYGTMTVSAVSAGVLAVGQVVAGAGVTAGTIITALISGTGGTGTYAVSPTQTASSTTMTSGAATVAYDSTAAAFIITGGTPGTGTIGYGSGAIATALSFTQALGAVISQGAPIAVPGTFMAAAVLQTTDWVSFTTLFNPVTADKVAFAAWCNTQDIEYAYVEWAQEVANSLPNPTLATAQIIAAGYSGTIPVYAPTSGVTQAAALMGFIASIDFTQLNGRTTLAFRSQTGLPVEVTNGQIASQLVANGFNFYGTYSTANDAFTWYQEGVVTGPFEWIDTYVDAIWLKNELQLALMSLLGAVPSIPYNTAGYALIAAACADPINAAINFGAIRTGIPLSMAQAAEVNNAAGLTIAPTITAQGYYLQILAASAQVRAARGSPPITLWYTDGGSIQKVTLQSLVIQ